jgi:hypothetical protein
MVFTLAQINDIIGIMKKHRLVFIAEQLGLNYLSQADKDILTAAGFDLTKYTNSQGIIDHAYLFGLLSEALGDKRAKGMNYNQFLKFLKSGNFVPLTQDEEFALEQLKNRAYTDLNSLGNRIATGTSNTIIKANQTQQNKLRAIVKDKAIKAVEYRQTAAQLASELGHATDDWERDWLRIAYYLTHEAYNTGRAKSIFKEHGDEAEVWFAVLDGACKHCRELYLTDPDDPDSEPIVFKLKDLIANGSNIGRKAADYKATIAPIHPYCRCLLYKKLPNTEWDRATRSFSKVKKYVPKNKKLQGVNIRSLIKITKAEENEIEKAKHQVGDIHPNGKWVWTEYQPGKFDWRGKANKNTSTPKQTVKFPETELIDDYQVAADLMDAKDKKRLAAKYEVNSNKAADIQTKILGLIQQHRHGKTAFTGDDIKYWSRLYPNRGNYQKMKEALENESDIFVDFLLQKHKEKADKVINRTNLSLRDKSIIVDYKNIVRFTNEKKNSKDVGLNQLIGKLSQQTKAFKTVYLDKTEKYAKATWQSTKERYDSTKKLISEIQTDDTINDIERSNRLAHQRDVLNKCRGIIYLSQDDYAKKVVNDAENTFNNDIRMIADKIRKRNINENVMQVKPLSVGGYGIDMTIGDDTRALYARAIIAAENSIYMRPHYRFIITETKQPTVNKFQPTHPDIYDAVVKSYHKGGGFEFDSSEIDFETNLDDTEKYEILREIKFTGMVPNPDKGNDYYLSFGNVWEKTDKKSLLALVDDQLENTAEGYDTEDTNHYIAAYKDGNKVTHIHTEDFEGKKLPRKNLIWLSGNLGLTDNTYWSKDAEADKDMMEYCGYDEYKDGVKQS